MLITVLIAMIVLVFVAVLVSVVIPIMTMGSFWFAMEWYAIQALILCEGRADMSPIANL